MTERMSQEEMVQGLRNSGHQEASEQQGVIYTFSLPLAELPDPLLILPRRLLQPWAFRRLGPRVPPRLSSPCPSGSSGSSLAAASPLRSGAGPVLTAPERGQAARSPGSPGVLSPP